MDERGVPIDLSSQPITVLAAIFAVAAGIVWAAGTWLTRLVDQFTEKTGIGHAFAGMLLLGGITSTPEIATVATATTVGNPTIAVNNLLGSAAINVLLLAICDFCFRRGALTSLVAKPVTLLQGVLSMILLAAVALVVTTGDFEIPVIGIGLGVLVLSVGCVQALRLSARFQHAHVWDAVGKPDIQPYRPERRDRSRGTLIALMSVAGLIILLAGAALSLTGDAISQQTGMSASMVGFVLVGISTSLPELSSIVAAFRLRRYEMALGDIFGTNLFNILLLLLADILYRDGPVLGEAGAFEAAAASLGALMVGIFVVGLLERRDRTVLRMGYDSALVMVTFAAGLFALSRLS